MSREISIMTPEHVELTFELAGLGSRLLAILLDTLIQTLVAIFLVLILVFSGAVAGTCSSDSHSTWVQAILILVIFALAEGYFLYFEAVSNGQTPGKRAVGIRVIRDTGHPLDFRSALLRNIMRAVDSLPGCYAVGFISVFLNSEYRRLGDMVAGTLVVKTHPKAVSDSTSIPSDAAETQDTALRIPEEALPYLSLVTKEDYRTVKHFLGRRAELTPDLAQSLAEQISEPLAEKLHLESENLAYPILFLEQLAAEWERRKIH